MKTVAVYPYPSENDSNAYVKMILDYAGRSDLNFVPFQNSIVSTLYMRKNNVQAVYFNWYESFEDKTLIITVRRFIKRFLSLYILKKQNVDILVTVHNKRPHDLRWRILSGFFSKFLYKNSTGLIILCEETKNVLIEQFGKNFYSKYLEKKIVKIPHPTYTGIYPMGNRNLKEEFRIESDEMVIMYLGSIKKYKNVELIIQLARFFQTQKFRCRIIIAGGCSDKKYYEGLIQSVASLHNLTIIPRFIEDKEIDNFMRAADAVICPLNRESALNSGSCMLALTYGKQLICPVIGTISEFGFDLPYTYDYQKEEEHGKALQDAATMAYKDFMRDKELFRERENALMHYAEINYSPKLIGEKYYSFFKGGKTNE